ncbi:DHH family phosphoesterase [Halalkalibacter sp. APA_J-10(15)]|uniref:DHH family phosphoesterase n=1 Tax=Halalkalibacter sp. APA_J-10(15) TaxID=2933805 RepID=UPI001FF4AF63|nr:oligoribonuclease [Halalkalibacter sp. APA_J-10(15)]MCK0473490.1 oligoribonuclease [Halalkalibacter sp. APA_J-10(15)]
MHYLYSHNDLDGVSCGILARLAFGSNVEIQYVSIQRLDQKIEQHLETAKTADSLWITDLSINSDNEQRIHTFIKAGGSVQLIDHHKTALHLNDHSWAHIEIAHEESKLASATSLLYDFLIKSDYLQRSQALDEFVELVRQWDTWEWDRNENFRSKRLNDLFFLLSIDDFEDRMVQRLPTSNNFKFDDFEDKILDIEEDKITRYIKRKRRELVQVMLEEKCVGIVHAEAYHSELGNKLGKESPHLDYIAILNVGQRKMSFRTIHDHIDVSMVAEQYEGGGHAKAAGATLNDSAFEFFVKGAFPLKPLHVDPIHNKHNVKESENGTLYRSEDGALYYLYPYHENWMLEHNHAPYKTFETFLEGESYIKRRYQAWLVQDESYITFLAQTALRSRR